MTDELTLADAIRQLYGEPPDSFVASRKALVARARAAGDKELARTIGALRRPTVAAYLVNRLAADGRLAELAALGDRFRAAQASLDAAAMKSLGGERNTLIAALLEDAAAHETLTGATRDQLSQTFTAAIASPDAQDAVLSGALVTALTYSGFGDVELDPDAVAAAPPTPRSSENAPRGSSNSPRSGENVDRGSEKGRTEPQSRALAAAERAVARARTAADKATAALDEATRRADTAQGALDKARRTLESAERTARSTAAARQDAADAVRRATDDLADAEAILTGSTTNSKDSQ